MTGNSLGARPYPAYKPSGVPWLGDVPEHWEVRKVKQCTQHFYSGGTPDSQTESFYCAPNSGIPRLMISDLTGHRKIRSAAKAITERGRSSKSLAILSPGTLLYSMYASLGAVSILESPACINQAIIGIRLKHCCVDTEFLLYFLASLSPHVARFASTNTQPNLNADKVRSLPIFIPHIHEQAAIVRYLDHVDQRIRRYVSAKRRLIALLEEEKQAVINQAVTRGLDPNVRLKPSGVEWLGDMPVHWEATKLARVVRSSNAGEVIDKGWWGRGTEVLYTCARQSVQSDYASFPLAKRTTGLDLLLTRNGTPYVHRPVAGAIYSNVVQRITLTPGTDREWIALTLEASARGMKGYGVSIESLNYDMWKVLVVLVPPKAEQTAIVGYLDKATADFDAASPAPAGRSSWSRNTARG